MQIHFRSNRLANAYNKPGVAGRLWGHSVATNYIQRVDTIAAAPNVNHLRSLRTLRLHALKGNRAGSFGIDLTGNMRLVVTFVESDNLTIILEVVDYHD